MGQKRRLALSALLLVMTAMTHAMPYIPQSGAEVLERLPRRNDPAQSEIQRLRTALAARPDDLRVALALSKRYIDMWRNGGDPRYLGYAQAALTPWWTMPRPPLEVQVMRATLLQSTHHFSAALADLDAVLAADPGNAQAWLTRATILQVVGDYAQAAQSCKGLAEHAPALVSVTCAATVASLRGHAANSYRRLDAALAANPQESADLQLWVLTILGEMAVRLGNTQAAQAHFQKALALGIPDNYLLAAYADFLLDQQRPAQVINLLKDKTQTDALLLRYAIALKATGSGDFARYRDMLAQRFKAAQLRGDTTHQREQARFELDIMENPAALTIAQQNWQVQKEPADTMLLLRAAAAANNPGAAGPVLAWLQQTGLEDQRMAPLIARLKGAS